MKATRTIITLTLLLLSALLLTSCSGKTETTDTSAQVKTTSAPETEAPAPILTLADATEGSKFVIYRSKALDDASLTAINKLVAAIRAETGVGIKIATDWGDAGQTADPNEYAILVGETSFAESDILDSLKLTQYVITAAGNKIIIGGLDGEGTTAAIEAFIRDFISGKGKTITFSADQSVLNKGKYPEDSYLSCLGEPIENYRIVIPADADYGVIRCATEISARLSKLTGVRFPLLTDAEATDTGAYEILIGKTTRTTVEVNPYSYDISAQGKTLQIVADSHYAYEEAAYVFTTDIATLRKPTPITENTHRHADLTTELKSSSPALFERSGEVRVLIQNIWGNTSEGNIEDRMLQTALIYEEYAPDVIGLQECSVGARGGKNGIINLLDELGYTEVPVKISDNNATPLFYRQNRVRLIESGYLRFTQVNKDASKGLTWAVFETNATKETFAVISTHYWWQSDDAQDTLDRESNARESLATIAMITEKYNCPVILGGDFNCNPSSSPYGIIVNGGMRDVQSWAKKTENMHTHHTYPTYDAEKGIWDDPVYPSANYSRSIDHIFATGNLTPERFDVVSDLYAVLSSDHCPLILDFTIN